METVRIGLVLRALRLRRRWRQRDLATAARISRSTIAAIERGRADRFTSATLDRVCSTLGARLDVRISWQGEALDRLLDARHAALVESTLSLLTSVGWHVRPEVSFSIRGERGSIDLLGHHPSSDSLLVVEVKSAVPDVQAMLATLDRKARLAPTIAATLDWTGGTADTRKTAVEAARGTVDRGRAIASRLLVLPEDRTTRRRVDAHRGTFATSLPARNVAVRRWLRHPSGTLAGLLFLTEVGVIGTRHRVRASAGPSYAWRAGRFLPSANKDDP